MSEVAFDAARDQALEMVMEARRLVEENELRKAERLLREALALDDAEATIVAAAELGRLYDRRGETAEAMAWWELVLKYGRRRDTSLPRVKSSRCG